MRRDQSLTFEAALHILGAQDRSLLSKLDKALGGAILGAGAIAGIVGVGPAALAPLAAVAPIWGWVDQKNEAISLLRDMRRLFQRRVRDSATLDRRQLVGAAHTMIVIAAFFEILQEEVGEEIWRLLQISNSEKLALLAKDDGHASVTLLRQTYLTGVPAPSPSRAFDENTEAVEEWVHALEQRTKDFLLGLAAWPAEKIQSPIVPKAMNRYKSHYLELAAAAPEFLVWALTTENEAIHQELLDQHASVVEMLTSQRDDLGRIELLLRLTVNAGEQTDPQATVARANRARLDHPIIHQEESPQARSVLLPTVREAFVAPNYKIAHMSGQSRVSDENWWSVIPERTDLDLWFSGFALSADATRLPLLLLGHPGAGKSMLMKMLAAQLPVEAYTTVLVSLRSVSANAPIIEQVQQSLNHATNGRVSWAKLSDESPDTVRVLILDGLDELLQASSTDRSGFLQEVAAFQQVEAEHNRPAIVIVTSRTVVADRVDIPEDSTVLKIEEFNIDQIGRWLHVWNTINSDPIEAGLIRGLSKTAALSQFVLARQPLLLLMLALYSADMDSIPLDANLSSSTLYGKIFNSFARREVMKNFDIRTQRLIEVEIESKISRLCIAALAMFNRGVQNVTEGELTADLASLKTPNDSSAKVEEPGQHLLGEFFFVHTAEATTLGIGNSLNRGGDESRPPESNTKSRRSYEFLHATFGEYLVAYRILEELRDTAERAYAGRRPRDPEDEGLYTLMSHQPLASRRTILSFAAELFESLELRERTSVLNTLSYLCKNYRRHTKYEKSGTYQPLPPDRLRQLASYSANLVVLRIVLAGSNRAVDIREFSNDPLNSQREWQSTVGLWRAGLEADGWRTMMGLFTNHNNKLIQTALGPHALEITTANSDYLQARLMGDSSALARIRYGLALNDDVRIKDPSDPVRSLLATVYADTLQIGTATPDHSIDSLLNVTQDDADEVAAAIERLLLTRQASKSYVVEFLKTLVEIDKLDEIDSMVVFLNICRFPGILESLPQLRQASFYSNPELALILALGVPHAPAGQLSTDPDDVAVEEARQAKRGLRYWGRLLYDLRLLVSKEVWDELRTELPRKAVRDMLFFLRSDFWEDRENWYSGRFEKTSRRKPRTALSGRPLKDSTNSGNAGG